MYTKHDAHVREYETNLFRTIQQAAFKASHSSDWCIYHLSDVLKMFSPKYAPIQVKDDRNFYGHLMSADDKILYSIVHHNLDHVVRQIDIARSYLDKSAVRYITAISSTKLAEQILTRKCYFEEAILSIDL